MSSQSTPPRAVIYRNAAKRIAEDKPTFAFKSCCGDDGGCLNSCCMVLSLSEKHDEYFDYFNKDEYAALFAPMENPSDISYWGEQWGKDARRCRVLALCFMAAMVETGDA